MIYKAIISGHIFIDDNDNKDIEILTQIDNDKECIDVFCDIDHALIDTIDIGESDDYYFIAIIKSEWIEYQSWEGSEWEVEHEVIEIKDVDLIIK